MICGERAHAGFFKYNFAEATLRLLALELCVYAIAQQYVFMLVQFWQGILAFF